MQDKNAISRHIMPSASTMVGVCMTVISIIKLHNNGETTWVDELLAIDSLVFLSSVMLSYLSIRRKETTGKCERVADILYVVGIFIMTVSTIILAFTII